ncbi:hypothetical protein PAUR_b0915 [Pseudoalteromonas aurantia 208]|uniref:Uncharacterized protein n=1 Tax=Pseudoalteromonas aurantia 208 TaxID=1314867 RepID=A0ABR9EIJ6_9GAMM|nr:hypothetical protein [Pseudoalteromonas aurantia 208]
MSEQRFIANGSNVKQWQRRNEKRGSLFYPARVILFDTL